MQKFLGGVVCGLLSLTSSVYATTNSCTPDPITGLCPAVEPSFNNLAAPQASGTPSALIYGAGDGGTLYTVNPTNASTTVIGNMTLNGTTVVMSDIAMYDGNLYGISFATSGNSVLYSINMANGQLTTIGTTNDVLNALAFNPNGVLYAAGGSALYTINVSTGAATRIGSANEAYTSSGDLVFMNGNMYLTSTNGNGHDLLYTVNPNTGVGTKVETGNNTLGFTDVYGLAIQSGILYGFTDTGNGHQTEFEINPTTGLEVTGTNKNYTLATDGADSNTGFYGTTQDAVPEPGTWGLAAIGLSLLIVAALRKTNRAN